MTLHPYNTTLVLNALVPAVRSANTAVNGITIDRVQSTNRFGAVGFAFTTGTLTDGSIAVKLQESDDDSSWADVAAGDLEGAIGTVAATADNTQLEMAYKGVKRYVRIVATTSGATSGGATSAVAILGSPRRIPVR